jgi:L-fuconolactonase
VRSRRGFLAQVASFTAAASLARGFASWGENPIGAAEVSGVEMLPIVDTHQHLWDLSRFRLPWQKGEPKLAKSFLMADYLESVKGLPLSQTVYMEVDVEPAQQSAEADYVIELCERLDNPMSAAVIGGHPASEGFAEYATKYAKNSFVKGMRQVLHSAETHAGYCLRPAFVKGVQRLGELGLAFDLCMRSAELGDAAKLARQCPHTRFILDHCGNMSVQETDSGVRQRWLDGLRAVADCENVVCKISGIVVTASENWQPQDLAPNVLDTIKAFGPDRVMFAGDWPVCTLRSTLPRWIEALRWITRDLNPIDQRKLFHDNAVKFYALKPKNWR